MRLKPRLFDSIPILFTVVLCLLPIFIPKGINSSIRIVSSNETRSLIDINIDTTLTIENEIGRLTVNIREGKVWVDESSCPNKICVSTGKISKPGSVIICAPNRIAIIVESERAKNDAITR